MLDIHVLKWFESMLSDASLTFQPKNVDNPGNIMKTSIEMGEFTVTCSLYHKAFSNR